MRNDAEFFTRHGEYFEEKKRKEKKENRIYLKSIKSSKAALLMRGSGD